MPLPLILGAGAAALGGAFAHGKAKEYNQRAERILEEAQNMYYSQKRALEEAQKKTEESLLKLGYSKKEILETSVKQFLENYQKIKEVELKKSLGLNEIENFSIQNQEALELKEMSDIYESAFSKGATGAATGAVIALAASGSLPVVTGVLSTAGGLAMAGNIGAAASLAGSALSLATSLTPIAAIAAPVIFFTGISSAFKAEENLEKARASKRQAELAVEEMRTSETLCRGIIRNSEMFDDLLNKLNVMFSHCNSLLTGVVNRKTWIFNKKVKSSSLTEDELKLVAVTRALAGAVKAVIDTPILTKEGDISIQAENVYVETTKKLNNFATVVEEVKKSDIKEASSTDKFNGKNILLIISTLGIIAGGIYYFKPQYKKINLPKINLEKVVPKKVEKPLENNTKTIKKEKQKENNTQITKKEIKTKKEEPKKKNNKYTGPERNQFIILNGKNVFIDDKGNILE